MMQLILLQLSTFTNTITSLATRPNWPNNNKPLHHFRLFVCLWCNQTHSNKYKKWLGKYLMTIIVIRWNFGCLGTFSPHSCVFSASCWWLWVLCRGQNESSALSSLSCLNPPEEFVHFHNRCERRQLFFLFFSPPQLLKGHPRFLFLLLFFM